MQVVDERELLVAYQPGNPAASERIVRVYQNELLRTAFLLTGSQDEAVLLARESLLRLFRELLRGQVEDDGRAWLLGIAGRLFLSGEYLVEEEPDGPALPPVIPFQADQPRRFAVEDERTRLIAALERLDGRDRTGLVLREFNGLDEEAVCRVLDEPPFDLRQRVHPARQRIRDAAGVGEDYSVRELLSTAAASAPRPNLWAEVEAPLQALQAQEEERRQRYAYGAGLLVALVLLGGALWLFDVFPFGGGEDTAAIAATATPAPPTPTPEPTMTPTPLPDLASFNIPDGDVPGTLLLSTWGNIEGQDEREAALYDLQTDSYISLGSTDYSVGISPDGSLVFVSDVRAGNGGLVPLRAMNSRTGEQIWEATVPALMSVAATRDRLYVVGRERPHSLIALDLETGEEVDRWEGAVLGLETGFDTVRFVTLIAAPDGSRLFVAVEEYSEGPAILTSRTLASYSLPGMVLESVSSQTDSTGSRQFPVDFIFSSSKPTPDGRYIYHLAGDTVLFRNGHLNEDLNLAIPFTPVAANTQPDLYSTTSNDGRYLYVIATSRQEVAVVDLLARSVALVAPLDSGTFQIQPIAPAVGALRLDASSVVSLSPDGGRLFLAGAWEDPALPFDSSRTPVWVIDVATWQVIDRLDVRGLAWHVSALGSIIAVHSTGSEVVVGQEYVTLFDSRSGDVIVERGDITLPDWIQGYIASSLLDEYRRVYGRAPALDGVEPALAETASALPRVEVEPSTEAAPAGSTFEIDVRFLDPAGGDVLRERRDAVRFDPASTVIVRLYHDAGEAEDIVLVPNPVEPGIYQTLAALETDGLWGIRVTVTAQDGTEWSVDRPRMVNIVPSFLATNGKRYIVRIETDPAEPVVDQRAQIRARFVDVQGGEALPADLTLMGGTPGQLDAQFLAPGGGFMTVILHRQEDGSYSGHNVFWEAGRWEAQVRFPVDGEQQTGGAGVIAVVDAS